MKNEFCIMPKSHLYETERFSGYERHEVIFGRCRRKKSIELGLVVFLRPDDHRGANGVHHNRLFDLALKRIAQRAAMDYYGWSTEDFIREFGKNYLED